MDIKENRKRWKQIVDRQMVSGKTIRQFCSENDVNVHQFHYYKRQFRQKDMLPAKSDFVEVITPDVIINHDISLSLNGIEVTMDQKNFVKLLETVKQLD